MSAETFTPRNPAEEPSIDEIVFSDIDTYVVPSRKEGTTYHMTPSEVSNGMVVFAGKAADGSGETQFKPMTIGDYLNNKERLPKLVVDKELGSDAVELVSLEHLENDASVAEVVAPEETAASSDDARVHTTEVVEESNTFTDAEKRELQDEWLKVFGDVDTGKQVFEDYIRRLDGRGRPVTLDEIQRTLRHRNPDQTLVSFRAAIIDALPGKSQDEWLRKVITQVGNLNVHPDVADMIRYARSPSEAIDRLRSAIGRVNSIEQNLRNLLRAPE